MFSSIENEQSNTIHLFKGWRFNLLITFIVLSITAYFLFSLWAGWEKVVDAFEQIGPFYILLPLFFSLISYGLRFIRWIYFFHLLEDYLPLKEALRIYIGGYAFSVTPGKTGEALRSVFLKDYGISYRHSFGIFLAERFSDVLAVFLLAASGLWHFAAARTVLSLAFIFVATIIIIIQNEKFLRKIADFLFYYLPEKFSKHLQFLLEIVLSFRKCFSFNTLLKGIFLGLLAWGLEALSCYWLLYLLGANIQFFAVLFIYCFALLVGAMTFLPGGLGGTEITLLQFFMLYQVPIQ